MDKGGQDAGEQSGLAAALLRARDRELRPNAEGIKAVGTDRPQRQRHVRALRQDHVAGDRRADLLHQLSAVDRGGPGLDLLDQWRVLLLPLMLAPSVYTSRSRKLTRMLSRLASPLRTRSYSINGMAARRSRVSFVSVSAMLSTTGRSSSTTRSPAPPPAFALRRTPGPNLGAGPMAGRHRAGAAHSRPRPPGRRRVGSILGAALMPPVLGCASARPGRSSGRCCR
jgi:hypothetical protein